MSILIIGASSGPGRLLFEDLMNSGQPVTGIARQQRGLQLNPNSQFVCLDAMETAELAAHVSTDTCLIHCSRPEILTELINHGIQPARIIALGSTRIYTRFPDDKCQRLAAMSHALFMNDLAVTLLHPTMIVGAPGLNNIERILRVARMSPIIPLPDHGQALIQPVAACDVVSAILACIGRDDTIGKTLVLAGQAPVSYREFIEICIRQAGLSSRVVNLPYAFVRLLSFMTPIVPGIPTIGGEEVRRLMEHKDFDVAEMCALLSTPPQSVEDAVAGAIKIDRSNQS